MPSDPNTAEAPALAAGAIGSNSVTVNWTAPQSDRDLSGYDLHWRRAADTSWTEVRGIASTETSYTITGLDAATAYRVQVRAVLAGEAGGWSPVTRVETMPTTEPTDAGASQTTTPGAPVTFQIATTPNSVTVTWEPALDPAITGFELQWRLESATTWNEVTGISPTATAYTVTGLESSTGYTVRVRAVAGDVAHTWSPTIAVATPAISSPPVPVFSIVAGDTSYDEGDGEVAFTLSTADSVPEAVTVTVYVRESGTMLAGSERLYHVSVGVANGGTNVSLTVGLEDDADDEPDSTVFATILARVGYHIAASSTASTTVTDDD